jgi:hypothetical protein
MFATRSTVGPNEFRLNGATLFAGNVAYFISYQLENERGTLISRFWYAKAAWLLTELCTDCTDLLDGSLWLGLSKDHTHFMEAIVRADAVFSPERRKPIGARTCAHL